MFVGLIIFFTFIAAATMLNARMHSIIPGKININFNGMPKVILFKEIR